MSPMNGWESILARLRSGCWLAKEGVPVARVLILPKALEQREATELELPGLDLVSCGRCIVAFGIPEELRDFL